MSPETATIEDLEFGLHIWAYFSTNCFSGFEDDCAGFYAVYRDLFEKIKDLELQAWENREEDQVYEKMPGFGDSKTSIFAVGEFYEKWSQFSTFQSFAYADIYKRNDAENRQIRRLLEKENKKERTKEKRNYIKVIKALVEFLRKRDPRYKELTRVLQEEEEKRRESKKKAEETAKLLKKEQRRLALEEEIKRYEEETQEICEEESKKDLDSREFYCEICDKEFKTENQLANHSQSKIHVKNVKELLQEVAFKEEKEIFAEKNQKNQKNSQETKKKNRKNKKKKANNQENAKKIEEKSSEDEKSSINNEEIEENAEKILINAEKTQEKPAKSQENEESSDEELDFRGFGRQKLVKLHEKHENISETAENLEKPENFVEECKETEEFVEKPGINKAKLRKLKKKQRETAQNQENRLICQVCSESFETKNQLFKHLKAKGHEARK